MNSVLHKLMLGSSTVALVAAASVTSVQAQGENEIEQVVVSGSRITIAGYTQPTPVTVVGIEQLERNGYPSIMDSIQQLPAVASNPSTYSASQGGLGNPGSDIVNLRFLGQARTLALLDGQRFAPGSVGNNSGYDIATVPAAVVQRVDVVTGGASAAWGSDAVAGVVNLVLNKNITGFKATIEGGSTGDGLSRNAFLSATWGDDIFGGRGHLEFSGSAKIAPDFVTVNQEGWYKGSYWVSNPAYAAGNGQPQLIVAQNVGLAQATMGGIINSSPAGVAGPGVTAAPANALRGIQFVGNGIPQVVNYGNITNGTLSNGGSLERYDTFAPNWTIASPQRTYTFFAYGRYKLTDSIQASIQINAGYTRASGLAGGAFQTGVLIKSDNAYIPASVRASMQAGGITSFTLGTLDINNTNNRTLTGENLSSQVEGSIGPVLTVNQRLTRRGVFTLEGTLGEDWSWKAYIQNSTLRYTEVSYGDPINVNLTAAQDAVTVTTANRGTSGFPLGSVVCRSSLPGQAAVTAGVGTSFIQALPGCIPLNVFGEGVASPAAVAYITGASNGLRAAGHERLEQNVAEFSMTGVLPWGLPAGKMAIAFGGGYRSEASREDGNAVSYANGYANINLINFPSRGINVLEGFAEIDAPVLKDMIVNSLDVSAAGRITSYSTSGVVETWKLGATSQVNDDIRLRTSWSVDIRAPNVYELFNTGLATNQSLRDPKTQNTVLTVGITSGNPNLNPEVARTVSGGIVLTPTFIPGLSLSADWYSINVTGAIAAISRDAILTQCNATLPSILYPGTFGNPNDPLCSMLEFNGPNGAISGYRLQTLNIAGQSTSGLDLQANYSMDFMDGTLSLATTDNYNDQFTVRSPGTLPNNLAGSFNLNGTQTAPGPKWKGSVSATYDAGPYSVTAQARWLGTAKITNVANTGNLSTAANANLYDPARFEVPFTAYLDMRGSYKWNDNIQFFGAIDNVLNNPPPLLPNNSGQITIGSPYLLNTSSLFYPMLGRSFRMGVRFNY